MLFQYSSHDLAPATVENRPYHIERLCLLGRWQEARRYVDECCVHLKHLNCLLERQSPDQIGKLLGEGLLPFTAVCTKRKEAEEEQRVQQVRSAQALVLGVVEQITQRLKFQLQKT